MYSNIDTRESECVEQVSSAAWHSHSSVQGPGELESGAELGDCAMSQLPQLHKSVCSFSGELKVAM